MQMDGGPNPVTTATAKQPLDSDPDRAETAQNGPDTLGEETISATSVEDEMVTTSNEDEALQTDKTPEDVAAPQAAVYEPAVPSVTEPSDNSEEMAVDQACQSSASTEPTAATNADPVCEVQKSNKKKDKVVQDGRKYVPSKKAMKDPLKMDMSSQLVLPLSSSELSLQCIECHIIFSDHKSKRRHIKLSHPDVYEQSILTNALFVCYVCERQFTNSTDLMAHQKGHVEKKPFHCPMCSQAFKRSSELTLHKKVHLGKDGYVCMDCGKACKTLTLMKYHIRTHTGERPYVCAECGERFRFSKALQKHTLMHLPEGAEGNPGVTPTKVKLKKKDDVSTIKHPCSICKATFKTTRTLLRHMKNKHTLSPAAASNTLLAGQQRKHITPVITPISICQPALLQVEPNGPLQKVDANIDTEPIRRLIESLGNVQKVNQVVILGQVPPHAPPLEVQQTPVLAGQGQGHVNVDPPQLDLIGMKQMGLNTLDFSNGTCDTMEQTIILEPITPEGQMENPSFSELGSQIAAGENMELRLIHTEPTAGSEGDGMQKTIQQPEVNAGQSDPLHSVVYNCDGIDLEQTVILELTPALMPTAELEQSQNAPQSDFVSSSLVLTTEMEKALTPNPNPAQTAAGEHDGRLSDQLRSTGDLDLTPSLTDHQDQSICPLVLQDTFKETLSDAGSHLKEEAHSQTELVTVDHVHLETHVGTPHETQENTAPEAREEVLSERTGVQEQVENPPGVEEPSAKEKVPSRAKESPPIPPVNVMSAQELVKVRKRKPARAFIFQGYMQELGGSIYNDDLQIDAKPAKRQRGKKSHLVVKFGPQNKDRKNKKQRKSPKKQQSTQEEVMRGKGPKLPDRKVSSQRKDRKGSKGKKAGHSASPANMNSQPLTQDQVDNTKKNKMKKQDVVEVVQHMGKPKSPFKTKLQSKLKQKSLSLNAKDRKITRKELNEEKIKTKRSTSTADTLSPHITQDTLLLLKGHKQPQLKVYKLDPSQASGKTQEASLHEPETVSKQKKDKRVKHQTAALNKVSAEAKNKGGRPKKNQKALSLLSFRDMSPHSQETPPVKSKTTRKRKSSSNIETEGVITSSERSLACKDCGERFSEVSFLQKHKAMVHVAESPGLTYTNGNIFEGVSRSDLTKLPKRQDKVTETMNAASDWDTEPEMTCEDRERNVSFPALIPSPSLPAPPTDVEMSGYEGQRGAVSESPSSVNVQSSSDQLKTSQISSQVLSNTPSSSSTQTESSEAREPLVSNEGKREESPCKDSSSESAVQAKVEDVKDDDLLEVDLVTVGEQNERVGLCFPDKSVSQNESSGSCCTDAGCSETLPPTGQVDNPVAKISQTLHVSCATQQVEIKKEDEELVVQEGKSVGIGAVESVTKDVSTGSGHLERGVTSPRVVASNAVRETESEEDCLVIYEEHTVMSEVQEEDESSAQTSQPEIGCERDPDKSLASASSLPSLTATSEESSEERVGLELPSVPTTAADVTNEREPTGGEKPNSEADQSPGIILEKFPMSRATAGREQRLVTSRNSERQDLEHFADNDSGCQEIKVEENIQDPQCVAFTCQNQQRAIVQPQSHRDIRTVLVKEESSTMLNDASSTEESGHIRWNVEQVTSDNTASPLMEISETDRVCGVTPDFNTSQCIFYPVKEEEREVLLGAAETNTGRLSTQASVDAQQTQHHTADTSLPDEERHDEQDYQDTRLTGRGADDFEQAEADVEWQNAPDLRSFLLQSSDEEDGGRFELSTPQIDAEAAVMAFFYEDQTSSSLPPDTTQHNLPAPKQPIDYFSQYFGWDTWVEMAHCTNRLSGVSNQVTAKEVAQFVGIHIAMGTLKFPCPGLYWEDLTKVPLIAEAMPRSRFVQVSGMLKLASPAKNPVNAGEEGNDDDVLNAQQSGSRQNEISQHTYRCQRNMMNNLNSSRRQMDPLWNVQTLLCRFQKACRSLRREGDYGVDQYPLPLTGKMHDNNLSLCCTTLIGFGGLVLHVDLKLDLSDKEDAVEKMVPKGSMVFLCKQELSTPAMLERLLVAGIHGAGRVGGAKGQIGDEFISSDGKLMLRRSHCGFLLSTAGSGQRNMASLTDNFEKAQRSARLNRDLQRLYSIPLTASAPTCWPQSVLWYLTDLALVNSWLLHRWDHRAASAPLTLMAFRLEVAKALILSSGSDTQDSVPPQLSTEMAHAPSEAPSPPSLVEESPLPDEATRYDGLGHWPEQLAEGEEGRCRFGDCQRTSRVLCLKCCVFLCISRNHNCFLNFHNQGSSGKR